MKVVSMEALVRRINRKISPDLRLKKTRYRHPVEGFSRLWVSLGDYHVLNISRNFIVRHHVDPEELARELGVLEDDGMSERAFREKMEAVAESLA